MRLQALCLRYLIVDDRNHEAFYYLCIWNFWYRHTSFSKFLCNNDEAIVYSMSDLSKQQARLYSSIIDKIEGLPWKIVIMIDYTLQRRTGMNAENVQRFNHGKGFVVGHQWTNIAVRLGQRFKTLPCFPGFFPILEIWDGFQIILAIFLFFL